MLLSKLSPMVKTSFIFCFLFFCQISLAGTLNKLTVEQDVVVFSLKYSKQHTIPDCVAPANNELWSLSLATTKGKAGHALLVTAASEGLEIDVTPALDCRDRSGIERAQTISVKSR